jgi:hypothetical protein|tara:strand:- start:636 stop:836 length:201 start_codon:yes stop_codon:yes gene_type:complete
MPRNKEKQIWVLKDDLKKFRKSKPVDEDGKPIPDREMFNKMIDEQLKKDRKTIEKGLKIKLDRKRI